MRIGSVTELFRSLPKERESSCSELLTKAEDQVGTGTERTTMVPNNHEFGKSCIDQME
jgi:hypothetical protein